jgi:peptidyl-prolyl cis-trans isomerase D
MIRFLQKKGMAQKILLVGILGATCVAMVVTLIPGMNPTTAPTEGVVAKVGSYEITSAQVNQAVSQRMRRQQIPEQFAAMLRPQLVQQTIDGLIVQQAQVIEAERMGMRVSDDELRQFIRVAWADYIYPGGKFIGDREYENFIRQAFNVSVTEFERQLKQELLIDKLRSMVTDAVTVTPQDIEQEYRRQNTKVRLKYAVLNPATVAKEITPSEQELRAYFEKNKERYAAMDPERRRIRYAVVTPDKLNVQVTPEDLQRAYNERREEYRTPEEVDVSHILITAPGANEKGKEPEIEAARKKAQDLLNQVKGGANFADLAQKYSEDPGSKDQGGSYKAMRRGSGLDPAFEQAAFNSPKGLVPELVHSSFGFHIIRVDEKREARMRPMSEVEGELRTIVQQQKSARALEEMATGLQREARSPGSLEQAAEKRGIQAITTDFITRMDSLPGLGAAPEVMDSIFSANERGGAVVARAPQGYVVFEVLETRKPQPPTFEQIRGRVETEFRQERAGQLVAQRAQELADRARASANLEKAAKELGATVKTSELVGVNDTVPDLGKLGDQMEFALSMKPGNISDPIQSGGNAVVFSVVERQEADLQNLDSAKQRLRDQVAGEKRMRVLEVFAMQLRDRLQAEGKIRLNQQEIDRLTATSSRTRRPIS